MNPAPASAPYRTALLVLAACALLQAWLCLGAITRRDAWYRNTDMNVHNLVDALAINSDVSPVGVDQPAVTTKFLLALDFQARHQLGALRAANFENLAASPEPLDDLRELIGIERIHSRILVIILILATAALVQAVTARMEAACLAIVLLAANSGLLYHGLLSRPDMLCVGFGVILGLQFAWRATMAAAPAAQAGWLFLAGVCCGLALLTKLPGLLYLPACYLWCWLAAWTKPPQAATPKDETASWPGLVLAAVAVASLALFAHLERSLEVSLDPAAGLRLRIVAVATAVLPALAMVFKSSGQPAFWLARARELALLLGGALAAILLGYGLLRLVMAGPAADAYYGRILQLVLAPDDLMKYYFAASPNVPREFLLFVKEAPFLFGGGVAAAAGLFFLRHAPRPARAFCGLLVLAGFGLALVLSRRYFLDQFSVFAHVPLVLVWPIILGLLGVWGGPDGRRAGDPWALPVILAGVAVILLTAYWRVAPKYGVHKSGTDLPVNQLSLTFIFDHNAHPEAYRRIMREHYGDRENFATALERYLADPEHRN